MNPKIITALDTVPIISLEDCRAHLRVTPDDGSPPSHPDDDLILALLGAARDWVEGYTGLALTTRTLELALDSFPDGAEGISMPWPPLLSLTSVAYVDGEGDTQTMDVVTECVLDDYQRPGWVLPAYGSDWPETMDVVNAVTVRYVAGHSLWSDAVQAMPLPKAMRAALLLILGSLYENREDASEVRLDEIPLGAKSLCDWYKVRMGMA